MSGAAAAVMATSSPAEVPPPARGREPSTTSTLHRDRGRDHAPSTHRSRSRSRLRKPKNAGSKLKGMVKSGWQSMRKLSSKSSTSSSDIASKASTDNGSLAFSGGDVMGTTTAAAAMERMLPSTGETSAGDAVTVNATIVNRGNTSSNAANATSLELVVLLMDPISRRFELLQLEFDSHKAKVSDLLTQIPLSVTEQALQEQPYVGVLDYTGQVHEGSTRLLEAFGGNSTCMSAKNKFGPSTKLVLVAKPLGLSTKETMRLAKPILTDKQVATMLEASGFDVSGWKSLSRRSRSSNESDIPIHERVAVGGAVFGATTPTKGGSSGGNTITILLILMTTLTCLYVLQSVLTKPGAMGEVIPPGTVRSKCGVIGWMPVLVKDVTKTLLEPFLADIHTNMDHILNCQNEYFEVTAGGEVKITDDRGNLVVFFKGTSCEENPRTKKDTDCVNGMVLRDNNTLKIGRTVVKSGIVYYSDNGRQQASSTTSNRNKLSPWPFAVEPKIKLTHSKRSSVTTS